MFDRWRNLLRMARAYSQIRDGLDDHRKWANHRYWTALFLTVLSIQEVREAMKFLQGYKTYLVAVLMGVVQTLKMLGHIDEATADMLMKLLGAGAVATVAAKINRLAIH